MKPGPKPKPTNWDVIRLRFESRLKLNPATGCLEWTGPRDEEGYGKVSIHENGKRVAYRVHQLAWKLAGKIVPKRPLSLDHKCDNEPCGNADHLRVIPLVVNVMRGDGACARNARKTECKRGHPFTTKNTRMDNGGRSRRCLTCERERGKTNGK